MTEQELEMFRQKVRTDALFVLVRGLYVALANSDPTQAQGVREKFAELRAEHSKIVLKNLDPAYSDMMAAEYQEALQFFLSSIESGIKG